MIFTKVRMCSHIGGSLLGPHTDGGGMTGGRHMATRWLGGSMHLGLNLHDQCEGPSSVRAKTGLSSQWARLQKNT